MNIGDSVAFIIRTARAADARQPLSNAILLLPGRAGEWSPWSFWMVSARPTAAISSDAILVRRQGWSNPRARTRLDARGRSLEGPLLA
jgi:hypothetical protein